MVSSTTICSVQITEKKDVREREREREREGGGGEGEKEREEEGGKSERKR